MTGTWYLYLDESGDLGYNPDKEGKSRFFTVCVLAVSSRERNKIITSAIRKTIKHKLNPPGKRNRLVPELKGSRTSLEVKRYFFRQLSGVRFGIYALTLNKSRLYPELQKKKEITYNYLARLIMDCIPLESASEGVNLILDKRKSRPEILDFNHYLTKAFADRLHPNVIFRITHEDSAANLGLQAVDMFCYGFFRKYEKSDDTWFNIFKGKVLYDTVYFPDPK
ncbi:MAG: DUF3800 domain-containing protein [Thermodesulfobacteriota bacterium]